MVRPPSAALENVNIIDGVKIPTSGASDIAISESLMLAFLVPLIIYNAAVFLDLDLATIVNFCTSTYHTSINWVKSTHRSILIRHKLHDGLARMLSNPGMHLGRTVTVDTVSVSGAGTLAVVRGLPSDISAPEIRRYLETVLYIQFQPQLQAARTTNHTGSATNEYAQIDTSGSGLWNDTCVRHTAFSTSASNASTPDASPSTSAPDSPASSVPSLP